MKEEKKIPERSLEQPISERTGEKGSAIGFTELLETNTTLIKHMINSPNLKIINFELGSEAKTKVSIFYMENLVDEIVLDKIVDRLSKLEVKYIPNVNLIQEELKEKDLWFFPTERGTERFDSFISELMQGNVGILVDNNSYALTYPNLFFESFQSAEEYFQAFGRFIIRPFRMFCFLISIYLPSIILVIEKFHTHELKGKLVKELFEFQAITPPILQFTILIFLIRILIDSSYKLNDSLVLLVALLGTNLLGTLVSETHLIDTFSVVVVSVTILGGFQLVTSLFGVINNLRFFFIFIGYYFGFEGLIITSTLLLLRMISMKTFGIPFMSPIIPFKPYELNDTIWRGKLKTIVNKPNEYSRRTRD